MSADLIQPLLDWIARNPGNAGAIVFMMSLLESLAIVGLFMPGTFLMFGVGAIVATGSLELGPTLLWAALGGIAGDGASFLLGRHFHQRLRVIWPFRNYPALMNRGIGFFHDHGGKSVFLARFLGPLRPTIPAIAGMLQMPTGRFFAMDIPSALLWAPAYILPGVLFGASLELAAQVAGRLAVLLVVLLIILWFGIWVVRRATRYFQPRATAFAISVLEWSRNHPRVQPLAGALLDPDHPEWRGLAVLSLLLLTACVAFTAVFAAVLYSPLLANLDQLLYHFLQNLRTPWANQVMVIVTELGDSLFLGGILLSGSAWLFYRRRWSALQHWWGLAIATWLNIHVLKILLKIPRPEDFAAHIGGYAFPSGHAALSVAIYGFLAVLVAGRLKATVHWVPYTLAACLVIPIGFSRLYLGAHWLSDVVGGLALGLAWLALFGIAYRRHPRPGPHWKGLALTVGITMLVLGGMYTHYRYTPDLARYVPTPQIQTLSANAWWEREWQRVRAWREDMEGSLRHPLNLQWSGHVEDMRRLLLAAGWQEPAGLSLQGARAWLLPDAAAGSLPVLPQLHAGYHDVLRMTRAIDGQSLLVLRLWPTDYRIRDMDTSLWVGAISIMEVKSLFGALKILTTTTRFNDAMAVFTRNPPSFVSREARRAPGVTEIADVPGDWDATVLLAAPPGFRIP